MINNNNNIVSLLIVFVLIIITSSCSVRMAAKKEGISPKEVQYCKTRACLLAKGGELVSKKKNKNNELIEFYRFKKETGSTSRAVMHGVLDVATLGLWEIAGTSIEGNKAKKGFFVVKVYYEKDGEHIKKIELYY